MPEKNKGDGVSRRDTLKMSAGATLPFMGSNLSFSTSKKNPDSGKYLTGGPNNPISEKAIKGLRNAFLSKQGIKEGVVTDSPINDSEEVYGYAIQVRDEDGEVYPEEYIETVPVGLSPSQRQNLASGIHRRVEAVANDAQLSDDPYQNQPGFRTAGFGGSTTQSVSGGNHTQYDDAVWSTVGEVRKATYVNYSYEYNTCHSGSDTVGRLDMDVPVYRNDNESETQEEWACVVELEVWPGTYLEQYDDDVGSNEVKWENHNAWTKQFWDGNMGPYDVHAGSPTGKDTNSFDGGITFGVSAEKTAYAEVSISPDGDSIHYEEQSDPGETVETRWSFQNSATTTHAVVGNAGACWADAASPSNRILLDARTEAEFYGNPEVIGNYGCADSTATPSESLSETLVIGEF